MPGSTELTDLLDTVARILLRCFLLGVLLLLIWFGIYTLADDWVLKIHGTWFDLTKHELDLIHYCEMGFVKGCLFVFFLFPYIAIRLVLRRRNS